MCIEGDGENDNIGSKRKKQVKIILINDETIIGKIWDYFYAEDEEDEEYDSFVFEETTGYRSIIYENEVKSIEEIK